MNKPQRLRPGMYGSSERYRMPVNPILVEYRDMLEHSPEYVADPLEWLDTAWVDMDAAGVEARMNWRVAHYIHARRVLQRLAWLKEHARAFATEPVQPIPVRALDYIEERLGHIDFAAYILAVGNSDGFVDVLAVGEWSAFGPAVYKYTEDPEGRVTWERLA